MSHLYTHPFFLYTHVPKWRQHRLRHAILAVGMAYFCGILWSTKNLALGLYMHEQKMIDWMLSAPPKIVSIVYISEICILDFISMGHLAWKCPSRTT